MSSNTTTKRNTKYWRWAIVVCLLAFVIQYFYSCLGNDVLNVLKPYLTDLRGWTNTQLTMPSTVGGILTIPISFFMVTLVMRLGPRKSAAIGLFLSAIGVVCLAISSSYAMYFIALTVIKTVNCLLVACVNGYVVRWFNRYRGRALGFITIGSPANSATSVAAMTAGCVFFGFLPTFMVVALIVAVAGVAVLIFTRDQPEEVGCYVDGDSIPQDVSKKDDYADVKAAWPLKKIFTHFEFWSLFLGYGGGGLVIFGVMAFFVARGTMVGFGAAGAVAIMSVSAVAAVPISYVFGMIDDKWGTAVAAILMYILTGIGMVGLLIAETQPWGMYLGGLGAAVLSGAYPNLNVSHKAAVYGRRGYQHIARYHGILTNIPAAFGVTIFAGILDSTGTLNGGYILCIVLCVISIIGVLLTRRTYDPENKKAVPIPGNKKIGFVTE